MYKIKNITRGKLLLFDIGIKLNAGESVDLDTVMPREKADASVNLRVAVENELLAVLYKDATDSRAVGGIDPSALLEMERRIREQIVQQMRPTEPAQPAQSADVSQLTAMMGELLNKIGQQQSSPSSASSTDLTEYTPDDDKLLDVHAKALKRMTAGSSGYVEAKETTSTSDASARAEELGDLLK